MALIKVQCHTKSVISYLANSTIQPVALVGLSPLLGMKLVWCPRNPWQLARMDLAVKALPDLLFLACHYVTREGDVRATKRENYTDFRNRLKTHVESSP
jgi:hypothetical protein